MGKNMPYNEVNIHRAVEKERKEKKYNLKPQFQIRVISEEAISFQLCLREVGHWPCNGPLPFLKNRCWSARNICTKKKRTCIYVMYIYKDITNTQ